MNSGFCPRYDCRNRRFTGGKSRFLQEADSAKGTLRFAAELIRGSLGCVSKRKSCKFERIFRQIKDEGRRFSGAKSRSSDAKMAEKTPKLQFREF